MKGYFNRPEETALALVNGWLHTGDYGYLSAGSLFVTGRKKDLIIRHGRNYYPQDIELAVQRLEGVRKGSVVAFSIESGEEFKLVVVAETALTDPQARQRLEHAIREQVCHTFLFGPEDVRLVAVGVVAKTTSGKVRRQESKRRYLAGELDEAPREKRATLMGAIARSSIAYVEQLLARARGWLRSG
jgi:acyl-CoA synthetase (AMP-forming)/AMP-acid ligase II